MLINRTIDLGVNDTIKDSNFCNFYFGFFAVVRFVFIIHFIQLEMPECMINAMYKCMKFSK